MRQWRWLAFLVVCFTSLIVFGAMGWAPDLAVSALAEKYAPPPSQFIKVGDLNVHLRDEGPREDALPIVLLHGTSASLHTWDGWAEQLHGQRRVVRFDLPGFGLTGPALDGNYSVESQARTVVAVLDRLGITRCILVGNSLGGYVAWTTGLYYPERVAKLVLVDTSGIAFQSESVPLGFRLAKIEGLQWLTQRFLPRALVASSVRNVYGDPSLVSEALIDRYYDLTRSAGNRGALVARFQQTRPSALGERLGELVQPTIILWGEKDRLIPLSVGENFNRLIPNSELVVLPGVGHVPQEEAPLQSLAAIQNFLAAGF